MFYLRNPARFLEALRISADHAQYIRAPRLTSVQNPDYPGQQAYRFSLWEHIRIRIPLFTSLWFITAVLTTAAILSVTKIIKGLKNEQFMLPLLFLILVLSAVGSFIIPYVSNGVGDLAKQLFGFISLFDMIFFVLVGYLIIACKPHFMKIKEKIARM
jgi:hypothetical protein